MQTYFEISKDAIFCAYNVTFDLPFIKQACIETGVIFNMDYHNIDIPSLVWHKYRNADLENINLSKTAEFLGLKPEPTIHRALNGAMSGYEVLKKVMEHS